MANSNFFCRECGEKVVWGERVHRWVHETAPNDHVIALGRRGEEAPEPEQEPVFADRSQMIGEPLSGLDNIGSTGTLDGEYEGPHSREEWIRIRVLADQALAVGEDV